MTSQDTPKTIADRIAALPTHNRRKLIAIAGPPASGKSTLAEAVSALVPSSCVVPMDGFHLPNEVLDDMGLRHRKGAPDTFDAAGFLDLVKRLKSDGKILYPTFNRSEDRTQPDAGCVAADTQVLIVEGNYLLMDQPIWRDLRDHWDFSVALQVPLPELQSRLVKRWLDHGFTRAAALQKAEANDLINARLVLENSTPADLEISS